MQQINKNELDNIFKYFETQDYPKLLAAALKLQQKYPKFVLGYKAAGVAYKALNEPKKAISAMKKSVQLDPKDDEALSNLGQMILDIADTQQQWKDAESYLLKAVRLNSNSAVIWNNLAGCEIKLNKLNEAKKYSSKAIEIQANYAHAYNNLGAVYLALLDYKNAETAILKALEIDPNLTDAYNNLAVIYENQNRYISAIKAMKKAVEKDPNNVAFIANYANFLRNIGDVEQASAVLDEALQKFPNRFALLQNSLQTETYRNVSAEKIAEKVRKLKQWGELNFSQNFDFSHFKKNKKNLVENNNNNNNQKLKIGFVSGDFRQHAVANFLLNFFAANAIKNNKNIQLYAYSNNHQEDEITQHLKKHFSKYRNIKDLNDSDAANLIYQDKIQILFDLSGMTNFNRLSVFAMKPAPVQISWMGWFASTGQAGIDYFLTDENLVPFGENFDIQFSEQPLRLPDIWENYTPNKMLIEIANNDNNFPREIKKNFCFASFNNANKVSTETINLWAKVLQKTMDKNTTLIWLRDCFKEVAFIDYIKHKFQRTNLLSESDIENRILLIPFSSIRNYYRQIQNVDLILDSFPVSGMTTTADALYLEVPTLTLIGERMTSRLSATCLKVVGNLDELICQTEDEFVKRAVDFAENPTKLKNLTKDLRQRVLKSPLCDAELFAKNFEIKMQEVWNKFLNS